MHLTVSARADIICLRVESWRAGTSANDRRESALRILPERRVEFRRRQIENGVVGLVHARDDERIYESTNAGGDAAALILSALDKMSRPCRQHSRRGFITKIACGPDVKIIEIGRT